MESLRTLPPVSKPDNLISKHWLKSSHRTLYGSLGLVFLLGGVVVAVIGIWRWYFAYRHFGPAVVVRWSAPAIWLGLGLALMGTVLLLYLWHLSGIYVQTYPEGMKIQRRGTIETVAWEAVASITTSSIRYGLPWFVWGARAKLMVVLRSGRRLQFTQALSDLDGLSEIAKKHVYPRLLEVYQEALQEGRAVELGPLKITNQGLQQGDRNLLWTDVVRVSLNHGVLAIQTHATGRKQIWRLPVQKVPNVDLCFQLIQHLMPNL